MTKLSPAKKKANKKWDNKNKDRKKYIVKRSTTKNFILKSATLEDLTKIQNYIEERYRILGEEQHGD